MPATVHVQHVTEKSKQSISRLKGLILKCR